MKASKSIRFYTGLALGILALAGANSAFAGAIIYNTGAEGSASVALGINDDGSLNTGDGSVVIGCTSESTPCPAGDIITAAAPGGNITANSELTGLAYKYLVGTDGAGRPIYEWDDATSPGCYCEGWGVSASGDSGFANVSTDGGMNNLSVDSFVTDAAAGSGTTATSTVHLTSMPGLHVEQAYSVADNTSDLFKDVVTITNTTGDTINDVRYVRVMDWDIPFDEFNEYVTIKGTATTTLLEMSHDNGFQTANPLGADFPYSCGTLTDFVDCGPEDHGAYFRFNFGSLADGESYTFTIFYGATATQAAADAAILAEGIELFSYGQESGDPTTGTPATFIFGFKGVGGTPIDPSDDVPEPASLILMGLGLMGLGAARRRRSI